MSQALYSQMLQHAAYLCQNQRLGQAEMICRDLYRKDPCSRDVVVMLVKILLKQGGRKRALAFLEKAHKRAGKDPELLGTIGGMFKDLGYTSAAKSTLLKALTYNRQYADAAVALGNICTDENNLAEAKRYFQQSLDIAPYLPEAMAGLANVMMLESDSLLAEEICRQALMHYPGHDLASLVLAKLYYKSDRYQDAIALLKSLLDRQQRSSMHLVMVSELLAKSQACLENYHDAFSYYRSMNDTVRAVWAQDMQVYFPNSIYSLESLNRFYDYFRKNPYQSWVNAPPDDGMQGPVFLVGFPRSGTTMLDQILASHNRVCVIEEKENLTEIHGKFARDKASLDQLDGLGEKQVRHYRKAYWKRVMQEVPSEEKTSLIIDKVPLNTIMLGHIYRFFPEAKVIFVLRDPRDACLSCYQQNFVITEAMFQFLKLETTVTYYDAVMRLGDHFRRHLPLSFYTIRYEDVVSGFEKTLRPLLQFLGLEWQEAMVDFQVTARQRHIKTPSAEQVVQPLYTSSIGKWKNYAADLYPCWQGLDTWVDVFGYERE